jgi:hypothetical protein
MKTYEKGGEADLHFTDYFVRLFMDNEYEVVEQQGRLVDWSNEIDSEEVKFKGSLSDCNAWVQLHDKGYM